MIHKPEEYRACVGIIVLNQDSKVFLAKRLDGQRFEWPNSWQFPQGGIDDNEDPKVAAYRELKEETGICSVGIIAENPDWLYYDIPEHIASKSWNGRYKGQRQKWFLMRFIGSDNEINLENHTQEFCAWEWVLPSKVINRVVPFKIDVYKQVINYFSKWFT